MSLVTGAIEYHGAVVDALVSISRSREKVLRRVGHSVPQPIPVRLVIDTGSYATGLAAAIFPRLGITPVYQAEVRATFTTRDEPELADIFDVSLSLVSGMDAAPRSGFRVLCSTDFRLDEPVQGILGRDILECCTFQYFGRDKTFSFAF